MEVKEIAVDLEAVDTIHHIADVHIRNLKRHKEYKQVFRRLYKELRQDKSNGIIYLAGDIFHAKTDLSPESVQLTSQFLKTLADIMPTVIIAGNHDCNLNNDSRLDSISPVVESLDHPNLFYLKDSGVYKVANLHMTVMSVWDKPADFITADSVSGKYKIALHHGAVDKSVTDFGFKLTNKNVTIDKFDGYWLTLLGDIHKRQFVDGSKKRICYPGSLIQQNFGEVLGHGYVRWDIKTRKPTYVEIDNDYGYVTIEIVKGKLPTLRNVPPKPRLRLKLIETGIAEQKSILATIKKIYKVQDVSVQRVMQLSGQTDDDSKIDLGDVRDLEFQNHLISNYIAKNYPMVDSIEMDNIRHVNRITNSMLPKIELVRNIVWKPKAFKFSNMFSYGKDNIIDFTNMNGTYGLFAPNASGKSAMLDALAFCCFDKCSRTNSGAHVLNNRSNEFSCEFNFEINGIDYFIRRWGFRQKAGNVKWNVEFYKVDENGVRVSLDGEQRKDTNKNITSYLGDYDDFILTAVSLQGNHAGFIDKKQREKKELLSQFLDLGIFEDLYTIASEEIKNTQSLLRQYQKEDYSTKLAIAENDLLIYDAKVKRFESKKHSLQSKIDEMNANILVQTKKLKVIDDNVPNISVSEKDLEINKTILSNTEAQKNELKSTIGSLLIKKNEYINRLESYDINDINVKLESLKSLQSKYSEMKSNIFSLGLTIQNKEDKLSHLSKHEYDDNCDYCMNNIFVKDAIETKESLDNDYAYSASIKDGIEEYETEIKILQPTQSLNAELIELRDKLRSIELDIANTKNDDKDVDESLKSVRINIRKIKINIKKYKDQEKNLIYNDKIRIKIDLYKDKLTEFKQAISVVESELMKYYGLTQVAVTDIKYAKESILTLHKLEQDYVAYDYYLKAIRRDGIPYDMISEVLPKIETEINNILNQMVDFNIMLNTDGKNINGFIVYDQENYWPLELTSGMERFISSLAIRSSLINISNLPRPNFIAIDEGFGSLDAENLNSMYLLFDYLKGQFDFVLTISHLDVMRDLMDKLISVNKKNKSSSLIFI